MNLSHDQLRSEFERWLQDEFGLNRGSSGSRHALFGECDDEIVLKVDDHHSVTFNCYGEFGAVVPSGMIRMAGDAADSVSYMQKDLSVDEGQRRMREIAEAHDLGLHWEGSDVVFTSRKMFCLGRRFTLAKRLVHEDHFPGDEFYHFVVQGANTYYPFSQNTFGNQSVKECVHTFILHRMLRGYETSSL